MEKILPLAKQLARARWVPPVVILLVLVILGVTVFLGTWHLRNSIRAQIVNRDGEILDAVALLDSLYADSVDSPVWRADNPAGQFALALRLSKLKAGVLAVRLFDARGRFVVSIPANVCETNLSAEARAQMDRLRPLSRFEPRASLAEVFLEARPAADRLPLLSVLIPLRAGGQQPLLGVAELIQEGRSLGRELAVLDQRLFRQALAIFLITGGIVASGLGWAFRRLQQLNQRLQDHAASLRRANQELALAAKTSALGTVTAHIVHGLASPLNGLQQFVALHAGQDAEWQDVLQGTQRMQTLLGEIVRVLGEDLGDTRYELPLGELTRVVEARIRPLAQAAGVGFVAACQATSALANRDANLVLLILENLLHNALQATPRGGTVCLTLQEDSDRVRCTVTDQGPGIPETQRRNLFLPVRSTKPGGNGLGLALSQQIGRASCRERV